MPLVSRKVFAEMAGVAKSTITNACNREPLVDACVGKKIDSDHESAKTYINTCVKKIKKKRATSKEKEKALTKVAAIKEEKAPDLSDLLDVTLGDLVARHGTDERFEAWLKATKILAEIEERRLKNSERKNELVSIDLVKKCFIDPVEQAHVQILTDCTKTLSKRLEGMYKGGCTTAEAQKFISDQIGKYIKSAKSKIKAAIKNYD